MVELMAEEPEDETSRTSSDFVFQQGKGDGRIKERWLKMAKRSAFVHVLWRLPRLCVSECLALQLTSHTTTG